MALGCVIKRADALVVTVPTFVFITMLPGRVIEETEGNHLGGGYMRALARCFDKMEGEGGREREGRDGEGSIETENGWWTR
jgi:hypothetical protein